MLRRLPNFQPQVITNTFFKDYPHNLINFGQCFVWAYAAYLVYANVKLCDIDCHAFVRYKGKFYDSDRPAGVKSWKDLPATSFAIGRYNYAGHSSTSFKFHWKSQLTRFNTSWNIIEKKAEILIKSNSIQL